jgi:hypothetical protein
MRALGGFLACMACAVWGVGCDPFVGEANANQPEFFESTVSAAESSVAEPTVDVPGAEALPGQTGSILSERPDREWTEAAALGKDTIGIGLEAVGVPLPMIEEFSCDDQDDWRMDGHGASSMQRVEDDFGCLLKGSAAPTNGATVSAIALSPPIDVRDADSLQLAFDERGACNGATGYCAFRVEVHSEVDGQWRTVSERRIQHTVAAFAWERVTLDLDEIHGDVIQIRMVLEASAAKYGFADWRIDDLTVRAHYAE